MLRRVQRNRLYLESKISIYKADRIFPGNIGPYYAQLFSKMNAATQDMQAFCWFYDACPLPPVNPIEESQYFSPKPANATVAPPPSGTIKF
jgi:hypothetical protein